jgi:hypothetical protein
MSKDLDKKINELEEAKEKYLSENTVISIGGYSFTPARLMIAGTIVTTVLGGLYGAFEVYKDYQDMKQKIAEYVSPDLTEVYKKLAVIEENSSKTNDYTRDIKNDLKNDIRRLEGVVENIERSTKQSQREADQLAKEVRGEMRELQRETEQSVKSVQRSVDTKIKEALDNPLARQ